MSLIHEALEKLEGEKKSPWKKPLPSPPEIPEKEFVRTVNHTVSYAIAGVLLFLFLAGLVYFFTTSSQTENLSQPLPVVKSSKQPSSLLRAFPGRNQFSLSGITRTGSEWIAIINNQIVRVGGAVSGAIVRSIEQEEVILDLNGQTIQLSMYGDSSVHFTHLEVAR